MFIKQNLFTISQLLLRIHVVFRSFVLAWLVVCALPLLAAPQPKLEKVSLQLKWVHAFQFAGYYAAKEKGFYTQEGLNVTFEQRTPEINNIEQVLKGNSEYGIADANLLLERLNGKPVVVLASIFQHDPLVYLSLKSSGIVSPYEMKGKKVMDDEFGRASLQAMLHEAGISTQEIIHVNNSFNPEDLINGKVDVMSAYLTDQLNYYRQKNIPINIIDPRNYGIDFLGDNLFTTEQEIKQHPERVEKFLRASLKGWDYALKHPEEMIQLMLNHYNADNRLSAAHLRFEAQETLKMIVPHAVPLGSTSIKRFQRIAQLYQELGLISSVEGLRGFIYEPAERRVLNFAPEEAAWLKSHPVIRLAIDADFAPYEWLDKNGNYHGITADYMKLVEQRLGVKFDIVKNRTWPQMLDMAKHGEIDMLSDVNKTPERDKYLLFTEPYIETPAVIISHEKTGFIGNLKALYGKQVAIERSYFMHEHLKREHPDIHLQSVENTYQALLLVNNGEAYAYIGDVAAANYAIRKYSMIDLMFAGDTGYKSQHRMAATKVNPALAGILNKILNSIPEFDKQRIQNHWMSLPVESGIKLKELVVYILAACLLFCLMMAWNMRLKKAITQRRKVEHALRQSEARWRTIFQQSRDANFLLIDGVIADCNEAALKMFDALSEQMIGKIPSLLSPALQPDGRSSTEAALAQIEKIIQEGSAKFEWLHQKTSGKTFWAEIVATKLEINGKIGILAILRDISERKRLETELRKSHDELIHYFEQPLIGMMTSSLDKTPLNVNQRFCDMLGYSKEEMLALDWAKLTHPDDVAYNEAYFLQALQKGMDSYEMEKRYLHKNGQVVYAHLAVNLIRDEQNQPSHVIGMVLDITERKQFESELRKSHEELSHYFEQPFIGMMTSDSHKKTIHVNQRFCDMVGYNKTEMQTLNWALLTHPDDLAPNQAYLEQALRGEIDAYQMEKRYFHKDGHLVYVDLAVKCVRNNDSSPNYFIGMMLDITERKKTETELKIAAKVFEAQEGIIISGSDGLILKVNQAFNKITGYSSAEALGKNPRFLSSGLHDMIFYANLWKSVYQTGMWQGEIWNKRKNGEIYPQWITITAVTDDNDQHITHYVAIFNDITERKKIEKAMQEAETKAVRANQSKSEFLANMSHEIRTPMNAIIGMLHLAQHTEMTAKQRNYLNKIDYATQSLLNIINDILDFSKIEAGKLKLENTTFLLQDVLDYIADIVDLKIKQKNIQLVFSIDEHTPKQLVGDSLRLSQILVNLVNNAVKFTSSGKIIVSVSPESLQTDEVNLCFSVQDSGIGISQEQITHLFLPFTQADSSITRKYGGSGLGLVICKQLVELMAGKIWVDSQPGQGSTFYFTAKLGISFEKPLTVKRHAVTARYNFQGRKILLVEDNEINRELAFELLSELGIQVEIAENGKQGLERINQEFFDLVLMDIQMPEMDGLTATRLIRANEKFQNLPIIAMTAHAMSGDREKSLAAGMNDHLTKPIDLQKLMEALSYWLAEKNNVAVVSDSSKVTQPTAAVDTELLLKELPCFDIAAVQSRLRGNMSLLHKLFAMFYRDYADGMEKLQQMLDSENYQEATRFVHTLKGVALSLEAKDLASAAAEVEHKLRQHSTDLESSLHVLTTSLQTAIIAVAPFYSANPVNRPLHKI